MSVGLGSSNIFQRLHAGYSSCKNWLDEKLCWAFLICAGFLVSAPAFSAEGDTIQDRIEQMMRAGVASDWLQMLQNFATTFPNIGKLVTAAAYVLGFLFALRAIYYLKLYGELRTMMASSANLRAPLTYLLVAGAFLFLPSTIEVMLQTIYQSTEITPLSYAEETTSLEYGAAMTAVYALIQLVGYIAFIRGWLIIANTAQHSGSRDTVGKGLTHIVGGILAINIIGTRDIIWNTFGLT